MAYDSLILNGSIELMGGGHVVNTTVCPGATYAMQPGYDLGAPQPTSNITASLLVDGERPIGTRSSNRTFILPIMITGPTRAVVSAAREALLQIINQESWQLAYTRGDRLTSGPIPPGGSVGTPQSTMFQCFRAQATKLVYDVRVENQQVATMTITFPALPYGLSNQPQILQFAGAPVGVPYVPPTTVALDTFGTVTTPNTTAGWARSTSSYVTGTGSARLQWNGSGGQYDTYISAPGGTVDITGRTTLQHWVGYSESATYSNYYYYFASYPNVNMTYVLTDNVGHTITFSASLSAVCSQSITQPNWYQMSVPIPQGQAFDYTHVVSCSTTAANYINGLLYADLWLDGLNAVPPTAQYASPVGARSAYYNIGGVQGSAHTPMAVQCQGNTAVETYTYDEWAATYVGAGWFIGGGGAAGNPFNGSTHANYNGTAGQTCTFAFTGTQISLIGPLNPAGGQVSVTIDGGSPTTVSFYGVAATSQSVVWTSGTLSNAAHVLVVTCLATKASASSGYVFEIDAFTVLNAPVVLIYNTFLLHTPGENSPTAFNPVVPITNVSTHLPTDVPNGSIQYPVPSQIANVNADFGGTYSVVLAGYQWDTPANPRVVTVTIYQYAFPGDPHPAIQVVTPRTFTPANDLPGQGVVPDYITIGEVTLPNWEVPADNTQAYYEVTVSSTDLLDKYYDLIFVDTQGQMVLVNVPPSYPSYSYYWIDVPDQLHDMGLVSGSVTDRSRATSVLANTLVTGGPLTLDPGSNQLLIHSLQGFPGLTATYYPAYWIDRTS
jgi:hypothetical protein